MNKILKNSFLGTAVLVLFLTVTHTCMAVEEVPPLPMTVGGVALVDDTPAPTGTVVAAYLDGEQVEEFSINTSSGDFCFWISGTAEDEGKPVTFTVDGEDSGKSFDWESGKQILSTELSVGDVADSGSSKKSSASNSNSGSLAGTDKSASGEVIESSVPLPGINISEKTVPENAGVDSEVKQNVESSNDSSEPKSAPGFYIIYTVAGIILLTFGSNLGRKARRKP